MQRAARAALTLVVLAVLATAGAASVRAADDTLGASVESILYANEDRDVSLLNRSNVDARFTFETSQGWHVTPTSMVLAPDASGTVHVSKVGSGPADLLVRVESTAPTPTGAQRSELLLASRLMLERPFDPFPLIVVGVVLLGIALGTAYAIWRRRHRLAYLRRRIGC